MNPCFYKYLIVCFLGLIGPASGQNADSLEIALSGAVDPIVKAGLCNKLSEIYFTSLPEKSVEYARKAGDYADIGEDVHNKAISLYWLGRNYNTQNNPDSALLCFDEALDLLSEEPEETYEGLITLFSGQSLKQLFRFEEALKKFQEAAGIFKNNNDSQNLATAYNQIGGLYYDMSDLDNAFDYFTKTLSIMQKLGYEPGLSYSYNNVGEIYRLKGNYERALDFYQKAVFINRKINNLANLVINYDNIGNIWLETEHPDSAFYYLDAGYQISMELDLPGLKVMAQNSLAQYFYRQGDFSTSKALFLEAYNSASSLYDLFSKTKSAHGLGILFATTKDYRNAYLYQDIYKKLNDSISRMETAQKITRLEVSLEYENQMKILNANRRETGFKYFIVASILISMILISMLLYGRQKIRVRYARLEKEQYELEKELLQEDINNKNKELTTHIMYIVRKNELIEHLIQKLLKAKKYFKKENQHRINEVIVRMQAGTSDDVWEQFGNQFNEVHKGFFNKLSEKFPGLTEKDIKLCALLRLNLTTKEISSITHQSVNSIQVARTRLRKKLKIDNTDINLIKFLTSV